MHLSVESKDIRGLCLFLDLILFKGIAVDYMHCVFLGVTKMLMTWWFDKTHASEDGNIRGKHALRLHPTLPPTAPASAPDPSVLEKTKGHFDRRELINVVRESEKKPLIWPEHNLLQVRKE